MIVDLKSLKEKRLLFEFDLGGADTRSFEGVSFKSPINVKGELIIENEGFSIEGRISADAVIECTRCLEPVAQSLDFRFRAIYVTPEEFGAEKELELTAADMDTYIIGSDSLDLAEIAYEQILLELPSHFLCHEDCRGLCEKCGENRNLIDCNCIDNETDPRWEALRKLK
ncbi:MAG TPA: hypothetical protein DEA22_11285 [Blastocatellia bacterium]|nr:hypothetical protein [Blastocatellia bacterium]